MMTAHNLSFWEGALAFDHLNWRVEAACLAAWPSPRQTMLDGWALRAAGGRTRRANSANPLHAGAAINDALVDRVEAFYREQGRPVIFRIPAMMPAMDAILARRGYRIEAPTWTLFGDIEEREQADVAIAIEARSQESWLAARDRLSGSSAAGAAADRAIIDAIALPCGFAALKQDGEIVSLAFGALQGDLLILESVMTDPARLRQGFARRCVAGLLGWAHRQGARHVALQVTAANDAARALYAGLGLSRALHGYHYRIAQEA